jgi:hypothetical protein
MEEGNPTVHETYMTVENRMGIRGVSICVVKEEERKGKWVQRIHPDLSQLALAETNSMV